MSKKACGPHINMGQQSSGLLGEVCNCTKKKKAKKLGTKKPEKWYCDFTHDLSLKPVTRVMRTSRKSDVNQT